MTPSESTAAAAEQVAVPLAPIDRALARLHQSRTRLRCALAPEPSPPPDSAGRPFGPVDRVRAWLHAKPWGTLVDPIIVAANQAMMDWWKRQPLVRSALLARSTLSAELSPLVRRYPVPAVLLTAALGAIVARSGVWRWRAVRRSGLMLTSKLRRVLIGQLGSPATQSLLLGAVVSYLAARKTPPGPVSEATDGRGVDRGPMSSRVDDPDPASDSASAVGMHANGQIPAAIQPRTN